MMQPELTRAMAAAHVADLHRQNIRRAPARRSQAPRPAGAVRRRSGWLLVELGLRLVGPAPALAPVRR